MSHRALHTVGISLWWNCILSLAAVCHTASKTAATTTVILNVATAVVHRYFLSPIYEVKKKKNPADSIKCRILSYSLTGTFFSFWILKRLRTFGTPKTSRHPKIEFVIAKTEKETAHEPVNSTSAEHNLYSQLASQQ